MYIFYFVCISVFTVLVEAYTKCIFSASEEIYLYIVYILYFLWLKSWTGDGVRISHAFFECKVCCCCERKNEKF